MVMERTHSSNLAMSVSSSHGFTSRMMLDLAMSTGSDGGERDTLETVQNVNKLDKVFSHDFSLTISKFSNLFSILHLRGLTENIGKCGLST